MARTELIVQNLKCGGCGNTIINTLNKIDGVSEADVNPEESRVSFNLASEDVIEEVKSALDAKGYPVENSPNSVIKKAKSYVSCAIGRAS